MVVSLFRVSCAARCGCTAKCRSPRASACQWWGRISTVRAAGRRAESVAVAVDRSVESLTIDDVGELDVPYMNCEIYVVRIETRRAEQWLVTTRAEMWRLGGIAEREARALCGQFWDGGVEQQQQQQVDHAVDGASLPQEHDWPIWIVCHVWHLLHALEWPAHYAVTDLTRRSLALALHLNRPFHAEHAPALECTLEGAVPRLLYAYRPVVQARRRLLEIAIGLRSLDCLTSSC